MSFQIFYDYFQEEFFEEISLGMKLMTEIFSLGSYPKCIKIYIDLYYLKIRQFKRVKVYTFFCR